MFICGSYVRDFSIKMIMFLGPKSSEKFETNRFDYDDSKKQCLIYGQTKFTICEFKEKITEITETIAIDAAKAYLFHVQLIAPDMKVKTQLGDSDEITHMIPMQSKEKVLECKTRPSKIQGKSLGDTAFTSLQKYDLQIITIISLTRYSSKQTVNRDILVMACQSFSVND